MEEKIRPPTKKKRKRNKTSGSAALLQHNLPGYRGWEEWEVASFQLSCRMKFFLNVFAAGSVTQPSGRSLYRERGIRALWGRGKKRSERKRVDPRVFFLDGIAKLLHANVKSLSPFCLTGYSVGDSTRNPRNDGRNLLQSGKSCKMVKSRLDEYILLRKIITSRKCITLKKKIYIKGSHT